MDELQHEYEKRNKDPIHHEGSTSKSVDHKLLDKSVMKTQSHDIEKPTFTQEKKDQG